jgi:Protein of unknown function (DUF1598)
MQNRPVFSIKMCELKITDLRRGQVVLKCGAQNLGFYEVSRAVFQHRFYFSRAQSFSARTCAGNGDFSKSLSKSKMKCARQVPLFWRNSQFDVACISACRVQLGIGEVGKLVTSAVARLRRRVGECLTSSPRLCEAKRRRGIGTARLRPVAVLFAAILSRSLPQRRWPVKCIFLATTFGWSRKLDLRVAGVDGHPRCAGREPAANSRKTGGSAASTPGTQPFDFQITRPANFAQWHRQALVAIALFATCVGVWLAACALPAVAADPPDQLKAYLDAGEFGPAVALANAAGSDATRRDAMLAEIARSQAAAGDRRSALQSIAEIGNDRTVSDSLTYVKSQPQRLARGGFGGNQADFDALIDLITATIAPQSWDEVGGPGSVQSFPGGVYIDAQGALQSALKQDRTGGLAALRQKSSEPLEGAQAESNHNVRHPSKLRKISLVRLERQVQLLAADGKRPTEEMQALGGLQRLKYVLVYPEQGEIVLAGPAGDWQMDREGRLVDPETNHPVLRLDDLVVVLRHMMSAANAHFGCNITPTASALTDVQQFVKDTTRTPLKPGQRDAWLKQLRQKLGPQEIEVYGVDPRTRAGLVLVEADYRMKLIGMGLEPGVLDVPSYLDMIKVPPGQAPPPMDVLRWWFTLNYDAVVASPERDAFELRGQGVKVLSENEMLTEAGQQVHTGKSDELNQQFAQNFTKHFAELAVKYPIYAELQNLCDLALVGALMRSEHLPEKVQWHTLHFGDPAQYEVPLGVAPKTVETVINHRVVNNVNIIVGVSGGVRIDPNSLVKPATLKTDDYGLLKANRIGAAPRKEESRQRWWWDE